jgi:hypothetical protein
VRNEAWQLESFVDALVIELDKTRETLGIKAINQPLSYTVKDMSMDLQLFPTYVDDAVSFTTAQPGEMGSSKLTLQLAAITDRQVRESTKRPPSVGDIDLDEIEIEPDVRKELRKVGVRSVSDLQRMEERDVKLESVTKKIDFADLADSIRSARRSTRPPKVRSAQVSQATSQSMGHGQGAVVEPTVILTITGEELAVESMFRPVATVNGEAVDLLSFGRDEIRLSCPQALLGNGDNEVVMVLDPYSVVRVNAHGRTKAMA